MKTKLTFRLVGAIALMTAGTSFAGLTGPTSGTVTLSPAGGNANGGGLFTAVTSNNGTFDTFCISIPTTFGYGSTYNYQISSTVVANNIPPSYDYISLGTASLFNQFNINGASSYSDSQLNAIQETIWYLQGDLVTSYNSSHTYSSSDYAQETGFIDPENGHNFQSDITSVLPSGYNWSSLTSDGKGIYGVYAMNMYSGSNNNTTNQPQLYQAVPEPSTVVAGMLLLLPFGISTVRILRKNKLA